MYKVNGELFFYGTISLLPNSEGHKPKHNDYSSCGVMQEYGPVLSTMVDKYLGHMCLGFNGPLTKATWNWLTGQSTAQTGF